MLRAPVISAFVLSLGLMAPALAQEDLPPSALRWFGAFDQNKDGVITNDEMDATGAAEFARIDKDKSGTITIDEYLADDQDDGDEEIRRTRNRFSVMDQRGDGNGAASPLEFINFGKFVIEIADQNGDLDGRMSRQEFIDSVSPAKTTP